MAKKEDSKGHTPSPADREQLTKSCGGMPETKSVEERFRTNRPPKTPPSEPITNGTGVRV